MRTRSLAAVILALAACGGSTPPAPIAPAPVDRAPVAPPVACPEPPAVAPAPAPPADGKRVEGALVFDGTPEVPPSCAPGSRSISTPAPRRSSTSPPTASRS
jgi:hypothetical protein